VNIEENRKKFHYKIQDKLILCWKIETPYISELPIPKKAGLTAIDWHSASYPEKTALDGEERNCLKDMDLFLLNHPIYLVHHTLCPEHGLWHGVWRRTSLSS
jgi:hypothetical protein